MLFHGTPGSRLFCPDERATSDAGVRLVTFDRPGYGRSDPDPSRTVLSATQDLELLLDHLDFRRASMLGWSGGGPYALAAARYLGDRVHGVGTIASPGPRVLMPQALDELTPEGLELLSGLQAGDPGAFGELEKRLAFYADDPASYLSMALSEANPDRELFTDEGVVESFRTMWTEGARQGIAGFAADWPLMVGDWGLDLGSMDMPVTVWHGDADPIVAPYHARYLAAEIPNAELVVFPGEGHAIAVRHWGEILEKFA